jgi:hypothetical protein
VTDLDVWIAGRRVASGIRRHSHFKAISRLLQQWREPDALIDLPTYVAFIVIIGNAGYHDVRDPRGFQSSSLRALMKTSPGTSTRPMAFIFFLPSFCLSSNLRLRVMSPP